MFASLLLVGASVGIVNAALPYPTPTGYSLPTEVTVSNNFPAAAFQSYWPGFEPTQTKLQPLPVVSNPVDGRVFELNLTSPYAIPQNDTVDIVEWPISIISNYSLNAAWGISQINSIIGGSLANCSKCIESLKIAQQVAQANPSEIEDLAVTLCISTGFSTAASCRNEYTRWTLAPVIAQMLFHANMTTDGQAICQNFISKSQCALPAPPAFNATAWFAKPNKPANATVPKASGKRLKVLHVSDWHIDPRYLTGSEAKCASGPCCRYGGTNAASVNGSIVSPAPRWGSQSCDAPISLVLAVCEAIPTLTNTSAESPFAFTVSTGDLVSHDKDNTLSRSYIQETEVIMFELVKKYLNTGSYYHAMGNHDSYQQAQDAPHAIQPHVPIDQQLFSWNYETLSSLWEYEGWINKTTRQQANLHYSGYSVLDKSGLRIITLNTDLWYKANYYNFINTPDADYSGMLKWLTTELQSAEDAGERVWIVGHVLPGWDGTNAMVPQTDLFYQIVDRFSPHVIANTFFGHTHEDQFSVFYSNNGTIQSQQTALATAWMAPSIEPGGSLNVGFKMYEVDSASFEIYDSYTYFSNASEYAALQAANVAGPTFKYEYSLREAYDPNNTWPSTAPLNASFYHMVTENMLKEPSLMEKFTAIQSKSSVLTKNIQTCNTTACLDAKVCYMRSASVALSKQNCATGYGSVQA